MVLSVTRVERASQVPAFDNLSDDSSLDVHEIPSPKRVGGKHASPPPSVPCVSLCSRFAFVTTSPDDCFADATQPPPSFHLPLENLDEDLEHYLR
jgi:hypothetical protein